MTVVPSWRSRRPQRMALRQSSRAPGASGFAQRARDPRLRHVQRDEEVRDRRLESPDRKDVGVEAHRRLVGPRLGLPEERIVRREDLPEVSGPVHAALHRGLRLGDTRPVGLREVLQPEGGIRGPVAERREEVEVRPERDGPAVHSGRGSPSRGPRAVLRGGRRGGTRAAGRPSVCRTRFSAGRLRRAALLGAEEPHAERGCETAITSARAPRT